MAACTSLDLKNLGCVSSIWHILARNDGRCRKLERHRPTRESASRRINRSRHIIVIAKQRHHTKLMQNNDASDASCEKGGSGGEDDGNCNKLDGELQRRPALRDIMALDFLFDCAGAMSGNDETLRYIDQRITIDDGTRLTFATHYRILISILILIDRLVWIQ